MSTSNPPFQGRWGYHPCDYDLFLKLKRLHKAYWKTLRDFHRWHRWRRKDERNRVGSEPQVNGLFVEDKVWWKPVQHGGERGFKVYPRTVIDHGVIELYQAARRPKSQLPVPIDAETCRRIEALYARLIC